MLVRRAAAIAAFLFLSLVVCADEPHGLILHPAPNAPARYIVVLKDGSANVGAAAADIAKVHAGTVKHTYQRALRGFAIELPEAAARAIANDPRVSYVEQDGVVTATETQTSAPWGLDRIDQRDLPLSTTYTYNGNGQGVTAYIVDTGIFINHADFEGRASIGTDTVGDGMNGADCHGHGTHVSGTVAGATYGVAKGAKLVAVRVLGCDGSGTWSGVIAGIDWTIGDHAANQPAVINMSLGGAANSSIDTAVANAVADGITVVVAAGNESSDACTTSPARAVDAITVGATDSADARASFSNYGTCVDLFAPGVSILSAGTSSTTASRTLSGTSMASPHVAGAAALYLQHDPSATPATVTAAIKAAATTGKVTSPGTGSPNLLLYDLSLGGPGPCDSITTTAVAHTALKSVVSVVPTIDAIADRAYLKTAAANGGTEVTAPEIGDLVYLHAAYHLTGTGDPVNLELQAKIDGVVVCACSSLATPGTSYVASCSQPWVVTKGTHTLQWQLDPAGKIDETDETNNAASQSYTVLGDITAPAGTVTINGGAAYTRFPTVSVTLGATDAVGVTAYYVSSSSAVPAAAQAGWVTVGTTKSLTVTVSSWSIGAGDGVRTVYAWFRDFDGNLSATASDTITIDQTVPANGTLNATPGDGTVKITWTGQSDGGSGVASYKLLYAAGGVPVDCNGLALATTSPFTHTGVANGQMYGYRLCTTDTAGNTSSGVTATATPSLPAIKGDLNKDGKPDLLWWNEPTQSVLAWYLNGGRYVSSTEITKSSARLAGVADFNRDGNNDWLFRSAAGITTLVLMNVNGGASETYTLPFSSPNWVIEATGDFNGDGYPDIVWHDHNAGIAAVWMMVGKNVIAGVQISGAIVPWHIAGAGDFDGDGNTDLFWRNDGTGENAIWRFSGTSAIAGVQFDTVGDTKWRIIAVADYNLDGTPDLYWHNATTGASEVWYVRNSRFNGAIGVDWQTSQSWEGIGPK